MILITTGVLLFALVHLFPSLAPAQKALLWDRLGEGGYKGLFSVAIVAAIALIVVGWRTTLPTSAYVPPAEWRHPAMLLVVVAFWLFVISQRRSRLKQWIRHPQLTGVALWALGHLLINGESRSVILFAGLAAWSIIEMPLINRREGEWVKSPGPSITTDIISLGITAVVVVVLMHLHPWFAGMPVLAG